MPLGKVLFFNCNGWHFILKTSELFIIENASTGDTATAKKIKALISGYIPTISKSFFEGYYRPAYTYDKLIIGLIDAYRYLGIAEAKDAMKTLTDAVLPFLPEKALTREERRQRPYTQEAEIWDEPYILPENLFLA